VNPTTVVWHSNNVTGDIREQLVFAGRGLILEVSGENTSGVDVFIQLFDLAAVPANGIATNMLFAPVRVPAGGRFSWVYSDSDDKFIATAGLVVVASTTKYTKTTVLAASIDLTVRYKQ